MKATQFARIWRPPDSWHLTTFLRRHSERSKDCDSRTVSKTPPCSMDDDPCHDPCSPCPPPKQQDHPCCPPTLPPICPEADADSGKVKFWRTMTLFVALPVLLLVSLITYAREKEKRKLPREPFLNLPYMCRRTKPFPWGDGNHTLFHNPVKNPVPPHGYEVEDPNAIPKKKNAN